MALEGPRILGAEVAERFGVSFPIRFDYLDTLEGGHLSLQCHPTLAYARATFGLEYTQDETYYVMETTPGARVFLGLRDDVDLERVQSRRRERRTRRSSGGRALRPGPGRRTASALPDPSGNAARQRRGQCRPRDQRDALPLHAPLLRLATARPRRPSPAGARAPRVRERRRATTRRRGRRAHARATRRSGGNGWSELQLGRHPDLFFAVHRLDFADAIEDGTHGRVNVLNLVAGEEVEIETERGDVHPLSYAETIVVPAAVGRYRLRRTRGPGCKVVKAFVP